MKIDLEDVAIVGGIGYLVWRAFKTPAAAPTRTIARVVDPMPVVIAPTLAIPYAYPDYYPWGYGPTVFNFGGGRRGGGGHHHRGGGRRGRR